MALASGDIASAIILVATGWFLLTFVYRFNRFIGNIFLMGLGLAVIWFYLQAGETMLIVSGIMIVVFAGIRMIVDLMRKW